jgi:CDP-glucose 4,6-dehydratase
MRAPNRPDEAFWQGRKVLVTGHTGFKGGWLALWLTALGADVSGLSNGIPTQPALHDLARVGQDIRSAQVDVRDAGSVAGAVREAAPEVVFHLAAQPLVRRSFADPAETFAVNVQGTAHDLDAVRSLGDGVRAVVVVTSDKCYAPSDGAWGHRESDPLGGHDPYSASKAAAELVAAAYRSSFALPVATARAGNVIGGGDWGADRLVPDVVRSLAAGEPVELRNPEAVRPWQHVLNPLAGYLVLAEAVAGDPEAFGGAWNFGPGLEDALPVRALAERLATLWGGPAGLAAQAGEHPPENPLLRLDSSRARLLLGWRPAWDLGEGLQAIVDWHRGHERGADLRELSLAQIAAYGAAARRRAELPG